MAGAIRVPTYGDQHVAPEAAPNVRPGIEVNPDALSAGAESLTHLGNAMKQAGVSTTGIVDHMQQQENADKVLTAEAGFKKDLLDIEVNASQQTGNNAWGITHKVTKEVGDLAKQYSNGLDNSTQQTIFQQRAQDLATATIGNVAKHEVAERQKALDETATASISMSTALAAQQAGGWRPPMFVAVKDPQGLVDQGNIDIAHRPVAHNPDGSISTVLSMSIGTDKGEVLIPRVSPDGKVLSSQAAIALYKKTGQNLGTFKDAASANAYAEQLHQQQALMYASGNATDPVEAARTAIVDHVQALAHLNGWPPEFAQLKMQQALSNLDMNVLGTLSDSDPNKARAYFDVHRGEMTAKDVVGAEKLVDTATLQGDAMQAADKAGDMDPTAARQFFETKYPPKVAKAAMIEYRARLADTERQIRISERHAADVGYQFFAKNQRLPPPSILNAMSGQDRLSLQKQAEELAKKNHNKGDAKLYYDLWRSAAQDPAKFATIDLRGFAGDLSPTQFDSLMRVQTKAAKAPHDVVTASMQLATAHNLLGFTKTDQKQKGQFDLAVENAWTTEEQATGKPLNQEQRQKIVDRMMVQGTVPGEHWYSFGSTTERYYQALGASGFQPHDKTITQPPDVPDADYQQIVEALQKKGLPVTYVNVETLYQKHQASLK